MPRSVTGSLPPLYYLPPGMPQCFPLPFLSGHNWRKIRHMPRSAAGTIYRPDFRLGADGSLYDAFRPPRGLFSVISAGWPVHYWQSPVFIHTTCCCFPPERSLPVFAIGTAQQYRFAALEEACRAAGQNIGVVMSGGIIAVLIGPSLAMSAGHWWRLSVPRHVRRADGYLSDGFCSADILPLKSASRSDQRYRKKPPIPSVIFPAAADSDRRGQCPPGYALVGVYGRCFPLAMRSAGILNSAIAFVFQCHILGMFAPSFFTGS